MTPYGADAYANVPQMSDLARTKNLFSTYPIYSDQWSIDSAHRVSSFHSGDNNHKLHVKFDPRQVP